MSNTVMFPMQGRTKPRGIAISALASCLLGFLFATPVRTDSPFYIGELLAFCLLAWILITGQFRLVFQNSSMRPMLLALLASTVGYVMSDMIAGTDRETSIKTSMRLLFQAADLLALAYLFLRRPGTYDWLVLGVWGGTFLFGFRDPAGFAWKFYGAIFVDIAAAFLAKSLGRRLGSLLLIGVGVMNLLLDCRSAALFGVLTGAIYYSTGLGRKVRGLALVRMGLAFGLIVGVLAFAWTFVSKEALARQRESSSGRATEMRLVFEQCLLRPFSGYGSNHISYEMYNEHQQIARYTTGRGMSERLITRIGGHAELLQAWFEGGILGPALFLTMLFQILYALKSSLSKGETGYLDPVLLCCLTVQAWDLLASPFGGSRRVTNAVYYCAVLVYWSGKKARDAKRRREAAANREQSAAAFQHA
jgi:hypothetical protein